MTDSPACPQSPRPAGLRLMVQLPQQQDQATQVSRSLTHESHTPRCPAGTRPGLLDTQQESQKEIGMDVSSWQVGHNSSLWAFTMEFWETQFTSTHTLCSYLMPVKDLWTPVCGYNQVKHSMLPLLCHLCNSYASLGCEPGVLFSVPPGVPDWGPELSLNTVKIGTTAGC